LPPRRPLIAGFKVDGVPLFFVHGEGAQHLDPVRTSLAVSAGATVFAALTIYDMCKGSDRGIVIGDVFLLYKEGGRSGVYRREDPRS
jgi:hypothetical protein